MDLTPELTIILSSLATRRQAATATGNQFISVPVSMTMILADEIAKLAKSNERLRHYAQSLEAQYRDIQAQVRTDCGGDNGRA